MERLCEIILVTTLLLLELDRIRDGAQCCMFKMIGELFCQLLDILYKQVLAH